MSRPDAVPALEVKRASRIYGGFAALSDVNLRVEEGEIRALIGPNGAGKSTLMDVICGRGGSAEAIRLFGKEVDGLAPGRRRLFGLSRSFQKTSIFPSLSPRNQLRLAAYKVGGDNVEELLDEFDLQGVADSPAGSLSYGEQRRVDLSLALVGRPSVLLLDEPAAGLSFEDSRKLAEHLLHLARRWTVTVVLVEHDMDVVFSIADSVTVLQSGRILAEGLPADVRADKAVIHAYLGSAA